MATLVKLSDVVYNYSSLLKDDGKDLSKRGTHYEFQDYAYRLAVALDDLDKVGMYMRLVKHVPRFLLDKALQFTIDASTDQKSRLFLWKIKLLRKEYEKAKNRENFSYEYVKKKVTDIRNKYAQTIIKRNNNYIQEDLEWILEEVPSFTDKSSVKSNALLIGNTSTLLPLTLKNKGYKVFGIDFSGVCTQVLKTKFGEERKMKFIRKDFLKNSYKDNFFDLVFMFNFWETLPKSIYESFLKEVKRIKKEEAKFIFNFGKADVSSEKWMEDFVNGEEVQFYSKRETEKDITSKLDGHFKKKPCFTVFSKLNYVSVR